MSDQVRRSQSLFDLKTQSLVKYLLQAQSGITSIRKPPFNLREWGGGKRN